MTEPGLCRLPSPAPHRITAAVGHTHPDRNLNAASVRDEVTPSDRWEFDEQVTAAFDNMLERSIPDYGAMRGLVRDVGDHFLPERDGRILDVGCSRGGALAVLLDRHGIRHNFTGLEVSDPMLAAAAERFSGWPNVEIRKRDLREPGLVEPPLPQDLILSVLTLQFTPIEHRQRIIHDVFEALKPGGAFILVEKVIGSTFRVDVALAEVYLDHKRAHGYSEDQIARKRASLEGALVPVTARWNEDLLHAAGFFGVECFWRHLNFAGWVAVKAAP